MTGTPTGKFDGESVRAAARARFDGKFCQKGDTRGKEFLTRGCAQKWSPLERVEDTLKKRACVCCGRPSARFFVSFRPRRRRCGYSGGVFGLAEQQQAAAVTARVVRVMRIALRTFMSGPPTIKIQKAAATHTPAGAPCPERIVIYSIAYSRADSKRKGAFPAGREESKILAELTANFFRFPQLFSALGVDLRPGNDTINILARSCRGVALPFFGAQPPRQESRMGDCIVHVEQAETCGAWRTYAA